MTNKIITTNQEKRQKPPKKPKDQGALWSNRDKMKGLLGIRLE